MDYPIKTASQLRPILMGFRKQAGLTQENIAKRLGISQQSYAAFEASPESASVDRLMRVLRQFSVEMTLSSGDDAGVAVESEQAPVVVAKKAALKAALKPESKPAPKAATNTRRTAKKREPW